MDSALRQQGLLTIDRGEPLRLRDAAGRHLSVVRGVVWITQHGDRRDPVIESGGSFRFDRDGLSLVQPLGGPAVVLLEAGLVPETRKHRTAGTLGSLSDHLLRDLGLRREQIQLGGRAPPCSYC